MKLSAAISDRVLLEKLGVLNWVTGDVTLARDIDRPQHLINSLFNWHHPPL